MLRNSNNFIERSMLGVLIKTAVCVLCTCTRYYRQATNVCNTLIVKYMSPATDVMPTLTETPGQRHRLRLRLPSLRAISLRRASQSKDQFEGVVVDYLQVS